ncbi:helix-turn-helix transcriptional regulator [Candidatus Gottesmanbacteria bacterium]|nr:helix-turn-helix transcriptional regulator [Candidatus Gottesmanbacteria bacterium]
MSRRTYTLQDHLNESLKNPAFRAAWEASEVEYQLSRQIISKRLKSKMTQKQLAAKAKTTQAVISRLERMTTNVSVELLKRIAEAFGAQLRVRFE